MLIAARQNIRLSLVVGMEHEKVRLTLYRPLNGGPRLAFIRTSVHDTIHRIVPYNHGRIFKVLDLSGHIRKVGHFDLGYGCMCD